MKRVALLAALLLLAAAAACATVDRWLFTVLAPSAPFDPASAPAAPDFSTLEAWAALPELEDGADVALPEHPATPLEDTLADVFYVHPTTWVGSDWNGPVDDPVVIEGTERGGTLIQASAFNACCAIYAPRYRQANGLSFVRPDAEGDKARDLAYSDVSAAFDAFLSRTGERPFIVAAHSQGTVHAARLVQERIANTPLEARLVAAYLPGGPIREADLDLPVCVHPTQTGCVMSWNARGPGYHVNGLEFNADDPDTMKGRICTNPAGDADAAALFFDAPEPRVLPGFTRARCEAGVLVTEVYGDMQRDLPSKILLWMMGPENYHPVEYQLFYMAIRADAVRRVGVFVGG
ncbi:MAG: DUF3089 domain-containing protein [Alphaproteobacteria bacterium]|nr:DUF3089 domain-containing protein [Alphaproteobacteria bacterium]